MKTSQILIKKTVAAFTSLTFFLSFAVAQDFYIVNKGDVLSVIARDHIGSPIYKRKGSLAKLKRYNPQIDKTHLIFPGQKIYLNPAPQQTATNSVRRDVADTSEVMALPASPEKLPATHAEGSPLTPVTQPATATSPIHSTAPQSEVSILGVETGIDYFRIDAVDSSTQDNAVLLSQASPVLKLKWDLVFGSDWIAFMSFNGQSYRIMNDTSTVPKTIEQKESQRLGFEFGSKRTWSPRSQTTVSLGIDEKLFVSSRSISEIVINKSSITAFTLQHDGTIVSGQRTAFGMGLSARYLFAGGGEGYKVKSGSAGGVHLFLRHDLKAYSFHGKLTYGYEKQDTSLVKQSRTDLGAVFGISWRFDE